MLSITNAAPLAFSTTMVHSIAPIRGSALRMQETAAAEPPAPPPLPKYATAALTCASRARTHVKRLLVLAFCVATRTIPSHGTLI